MAAANKDLPQKSSKAAIDAFVQQVRSTPALKSGRQRGRLMFAMDATASREPSWDRACQIQGEMFTETAALGGLDIQLCYYRGFGEFEASPWLSSADALLQRMTRVSCRGGYTQIEKVLRLSSKPGKRKSRRSCSLAIAWRRTSTACAIWRASWGCSGCRLSCFMKVRTLPRSGPSRRLRA
jgi:hypothetical protein